MNSFDGCSFPECCLEPPGLPNMSVPDQFGAADCFRNAMKTEISAISTLSTPFKNMLNRRLDNAGASQTNSCRGLRHAIVLKAMVCRRLDVLNFLGRISTEEHLQLGRKCATLDAWYSHIADSEGCPR